MPTLAPIAGCPLVTLAPEPCAPTWPADPLETLPILARRQTPRVDEPPFTGSHWVSRTGMPVRSSVPTGVTITFKGRLYMAYQTLLVGVGGAGPIATNWWAGAIVSTADAVTWSTVFIGDVSPSVGHGFRMPSMFYVHDDALYCVVYRGGYSWIQARVYLGDGEIAVWKTTDGVTWSTHQVLVSWPAAGDGSTVGGTASHVQFGSSPVWRANGSGPAGETADWLTVNYYGFANVTGAPVVQAGIPQYRSLDGGETWTLVRDMYGAPPFTGGGFLGFSQILAVPRPGVAVDRWVMTGRTYRSDDVGATWQPYIGSNSYGVAVPSGGLVLPTHGSATLTPNLLLSCDYAQSSTGAATVPTGGTDSMLNLLAFPLPIAGGEEMLAVTKRAATVQTTVWHSTDGGESWADRGDVPTVFGVHYTLARMSTGRLLLYPTGGGGASTDLWTCDDAPTGIATPRSICPFVVDIGLPVGQIAGCASLTFITELCHALPPPPFGPGYETCAAPLGLFTLGEHCLGPLAVSPTAARRVPRRWSHAHAQ